VEPEVQTPQSQQHRADRAPLVVVLGDKPAAGANFSMTWGVQEHWWLYAVTFRLVTDANAANRSPTVDVDDGAGHLLTSNGIQGLTTANTTAIFSFQSNRGTSEGNTNLQAFAPLLPVRLEPSQLLQINVLNKQAGDQLDRIVLTFLRHGSRAS
jgi:hypothetical protein